MLRFAQHDVHPFLPCVVLAALVLPVVPACKEETRETPVPVTQYIRPDAAPTYSPPGNTIRVDVAFADVTASSGVRFQHTTGAFGKKWMPETMGGGGGFFDYNGDGLPDILLVNSTYWPGHEPNGASPHGRAPASRLFRNLGGGRFEDVSTAAGLAKLSCYGMGAAMADYDGDGDADVLLTAVGKNHLLRNDGGRFVDVTDAAGVGFSTCDGPASRWEWSTGAVWVDHDRDGDLDLFVANYVTWTPETDIWTTLDGKTKSYATPQQYAGATCVLFRNDGDGTFTDVTKPAGLFNADGKSMSVLTDDFNDDGWPDLVVTNDTQPNFLYINNTDGTFTDQALSAGVAYDENGLARAGMGVSATDLTNQGSRSIAIGNFSGEPLSLYTQTDGRTFVDLAGATRLSRPTNRVLSFGVLFADLNLDGFDDLLLANGHIEPSIAAVREGWTFAQPPQLFLNNRRRRFVDLGPKLDAAVTAPMVGRSVAVADIDGDGDPDVLLTANGGSPRLLRNDCPGATRSIRIRLVGKGKNREAIGARLRATIGDMTVSRFVTTGGSYLAQSELTVTIGLGESESIDELQIRWPDGTEEHFDSLPGGHGRSITYVIEQDKGVIDSTLPRVWYDGIQGNNGDPPLDVGSGTLKVIEKGKPPKE